MKTDVVKVSSRELQMGAVLEQAEKTAAYYDLPEKDRLHLRLLTEEMMGLMGSLTGETEGRFWIETQDHEYGLHLQVETRMDSGKRERLLSTASSGKNESARGLMGRLRDLFDRNEDEDVVAFTNPLLLPGMYDHSSKPALDWEWSMVRYKGALHAQAEKEDGPAREAWDELEKSVVAHVADEVKVSIRGRTVEMTILKKMPDGKTE